MAVVVTSAEEEDLERIFNTLECDFASMEPTFCTSFMDGDQKKNVYALHLPFLLTQDKFVKKVNDAGFFCEFQ